MGLFDILQVFDWISPVIGEAQDIAQALSGEGGTTIWMDKSDLGIAIQLLYGAGVKVVSTTTVAFDRESGINVPDSQVSAARKALGSIENW